jgi:hypothetical protein
MYTDGAENIQELGLLTSDNSSDNDNYFQAEYYGILKLSWFGVNLQRL